VKSVGSAVKKRRRSKLKTGAGARDERVKTEWVIPVRWLKQIVAAFLVPPAWILTRAFFSSFSTAALQHRFWASEEFWFFSLGTLLWVVTFFGLPRPMLLYVFGHELTHVIWVWLLYGGIGMFVDVEPYRRWLFAVVGFTWAFHITFAIWMLWNGQTDLIEHGTFFSMMIIYLINFSVLSVMLIVASRDVTFLSFGKELLQGAMEFSDRFLRFVHLKA
jgi:hypothetical protein